MKYCTNCGNELPNEASFCSKCGNRFNGATTATHIQEINAEVVKEKLGKTFSQAKGSIQNSGYIDYFKRTAKYPTVALNEKQSNNGFIHFGILSLITVLAIYSIITGAISIAMNQTGLGALLGLSGGFTNQVNQLLPNLFLMSVTIYGVFVFSAYMILKILVKKELTLTQVFTEFGGLLTPNIILLGIAAILTYLIKSENIMVLGLSFIGFTLLLCFIAMNYYIYVKSYKSTNNTFYALLISNILVFLLFSIIIYLQIEPIITAIDNLGSLGW
ncbi:DUF6574 domain-containing protein [Alkalibacterium sp. f15]|uniref:DUF6574 domain-containing protein n=1 Tax=Alkalibacterium sp. f15 TaxID=3414029 RepID=UPI003BF7E44B